MKVSVINNLSGAMTTYDNVSKIIEYEVAISIINNSNILSFPKQFTKFIVVI